MADFRTELIAFCIGHSVLAAMPRRARAAMCLSPSTARRQKSHGGGGDLIGAPLAGRVLIRDDVVAASIAVRESSGTMDFPSSTLGWLQDGDEFRQNPSSMRGYRQLYGIAQHA